MACRYRSARRGTTSLRCQPRCTRNTIHVAPSPPPSNAGLAWFPGLGRRPTQPRHRTGGHQTAVINPAVVKVPCAVLHRDAVGREHPTESVPSDVVAARGEISHHTLGREFFLGISARSSHGPPRSLHSSRSPAKFARRQATRGYRLVASIDASQPCLDTTVLDARCGTGVYSEGYRGEGEPGTRRTVLCLSLSLGQQKLHAPSGVQRLQEGR